MPVVHVSHGSVGTDKAAAVGSQLHHLTVDGSLPFAQRLRSLSATGPLRVSRHVENGLMLPQYSSRQSSRHFLTLTPSSVRAYTPKARA